MVLQEVSFWNFFALRFSTINCKWCYYKAAAKCQTMKSYSVRVHCVSKLKLWAGTFILWVSIAEQLHASFVSPGNGWPGVKLDSGADMRSHKSHIFICVRAQMLFWVKPHTDTLQNLVEGLPRTIEAVRAARGGQNNNYSRCTVPPALWQLAAGGSIRLDGTTTTQPATGHTASHTGCVASAGTANLVKVEARMHNW